MAFSYVDTQTAMELDGLRMSVVSAVPSPWGEAAKSIFHVKQIDWVAFRLDAGNPQQVAWTGSRSAPVALYGSEPPRSRWIDILLLAERLSAHPPLLPTDPHQRALAIGLSHELCGEGGLAWARRLQLVHAGLQGNGGFIKPVATYLADKYGHCELSGEQAGQRVIELLELFSARLKAQAEAGSPYYIGQQLTCVDIYSAAVCALFHPLPAEICDMGTDPSRSRAAFQSLDAETRHALDPLLLAHRDRLYRDHLETPLSL